MIPERVEQFREKFRRESISPRYQGWLHFSFTTLGCAGAIAACASGLHEVQGWEWSVIPVTFLYANAVEYFAHRNPMHHAWRGLKLVYQRHTLEHHHFYTHQSMEARDARDFKMILFPPALLIFFFGGFAAPLGFLLAATVSRNVGLLFAATGMAYFLNYEWFHFAYHQPWAARVPFLRSMARHHTRHHDPESMTRWNFNITWPLGDLVCGTLAPREPARPPRA